MGGGHHHHHAQEHGHHQHGPVNHDRAFALGVALNSAFVVVEGAFGILADSMALLADAGHNLSDVLALLIAWGASLAARRPVTARYTWGLKSSTILAALANAMLLLVAIGAILFETVHRLIDPVEPQGWTMIWVAGVGIVINTATALLFLRGRKGDINIRGAFLHMAADALVSVGVVLAGAVILLTGWALVDPLVSLAIVAVIAVGTWGLLKDSMKLALGAVPPNVDVDAVRGFLEGLPGVASLHDLHIWPMSTTETAMSVHLVMPAGHPGDAFLHDLAEELAHHYAIGHVTVQVEVMGADCAGCA
ncbi:cation diffusion facilitator family transporter [Altererythrobacter lauratis]|uniref:Cation diffusion facilitator family transporter n=1 Tax=Alteraurantiacibacter lauratis TaxID=2054627 RepID=A0ABV7ECB0_9SPHN